MEKNSETNIQKQENKKPEIELLIKIFIGVGIFTILGIVTYIFLPRENVSTVTSKTPQKTNKVANIKKVKKSKKTTTQEAKFTGAKEKRRNSTSPIKMTPLLKEEFNAKVKSYIVEVDNQTLIKHSESTKFFSAVSKYDEQST